MGILADNARIKTICAQLAAMAHKPCFHHGRVHFGVKLKGKLPRPGAECLMRRDGGRSQQVAAPRQVIGITVPVQHRGSRKLGQRAAEACGRKINLPPAYFLGSTWVHLGIKGTGHELCAKAYAQKGPTRCKPACHKGFLVSKKGYRSS